MARKKAAKKKSTKKKVTRKRSNNDQLGFFEDGAAKKGAAKKGAAKKGAAKKGSAKKDTAKKDTPKKDTPKKGAAKKGSAKKGSAKKGSAKKDAAEKDAPKQKTRRGTREHGAACSLAHGPENCRPAYSHSEGGRRLSNYRWHGVANPSGLIHLKQAEERVTNAEKLFALAKKSSGSRRNRLLLEAHSFASVARTEVVDAEDHEMLAPQDAYRAEAVKEAADKVIRAAASMIDCGGKSKARGQVERNPGLHTETKARANAQGKVDKFLAAFGS